MNEDPARGRFMTIQLLRLSGVALVLAGLLAVRGKIGLPAEAGYVMLAAGLAGVFLVPQWLARKWKTPRP